MKKIFYLASIAALAFSSCAKDETTEAAIDVVKGGSKIVAAMEADDTRTELVKNGNAYDIVWKSTDGLSVYEKGGDGNVSAFSNRLFQLDNASDGLASGAFTGSKLNPKGTYVAVYPYSKESLTPDWNEPYYKYQGVTYTMLDPKDIKVNIPAEQEYVGSGTFNTNTIPAISTQFTVGEDGNATVKMQPVVDYVMVDIAATENINNVTLRLYEGTPSDATAIDIAGTIALKAYYANGNIRYTTFLHDADLSQNLPNGKNYITLATKDLADDVSLAKANTYVFAIPGGILGMGKDINWGLFIHKDATPDFNADTFLLSTATKADPNYYYINDMINEFPIGANKTASRVHNDYAENACTWKEAHKENGYTTYLREYASNLENTVFYLNASDIEGNPMPFIYNPNGDVLIEDELDLLDYFYNYETMSYGDAYVAEGAKFDLSVDNLSEILRNKKDIDAGLRTAINDYIMPDGIFPVIEEYHSEFIGNGAVISNIERPLAGMGGLFGAIKGVSDDEPAYVQNITLANVVAATTKVGGKVVKGNVLASTIGNYASISKVAISKLNADAVVGEASLGNFNAISVAEGGSVNKDLNHIVAKVTLNNDYKPKAEAWTALSAVGEGVFHTIVPVKRPITNSNPDTHHVITLPAGDYEDLTVKFENIGDEIDAQGTISDASAVASLIIGEVSHWTGGCKGINTANNNIIASGANYARGYYVNYAEELANGYSSPYVIELSRAMNFEHNDLTKQITIAGMLSGGGNTVTGLTYVVNEDNWSVEAADDDVAPFALTDIEDIVFDGLNISIETTTSNAVPRLISGISNRLKNVDGVTINNLVIDAYSEGSNNTVTDAVYDNAATSQRHVGWLSAAAEDIAVYDTTVNGVDSNVIALSAMVSWIDVKTNNSIFDGSKVVGKIVKAKNQLDIKEFTRYNVADVQYNLMGSLVGMVENGLSSATNVGVKFNDFGSVKPVSLFAVGVNGSAINVLYNNKLAVSLYHADDDRNE